MCGPLAGSERQRGSGGVMVVVGRVIYKRAEQSLVAEAEKELYKPREVALNQIQPLLSEKSSSSLLHEVHIKGGL